ncbi:MAG: dephospho-CoA kinase [Muribaculum sp.]|nr:dephospho-CoA kinase [Muribaculum sp.]
MRLIGITGGIGAGKSVVSRILRLRGEFVYDCDSRAKTLMDNSVELLTALLQRYGEDVVNGGIINRRALASIVFGSDRERLWLNSLVHAMVHDDLDRYIHHHEKDRVYVESAILYESGLAVRCDEIWIVDAPEALRIERALARSGLAMNERNKAEVRRRIESQNREMTDLYALTVPKRKIYNDGNNALLNIV